MKKFIVHTTGGEKLEIEAERWDINTAKGTIEFYGESGPPVKWTVFLHGVAAIEEREPIEPTWT
jgi:hypothetical protein